MAEQGGGSGCIGSDGGWWLQGRASWPCAPGTCALGPRPSAVRAWATRSPGRPPMLGRALAVWAPNLAGWLGRTPGFAAGPAVYPEA
jgi:hypothetical protein